MQRSTLAPRHAPTSSSIEHLPPTQVQAPPPHAQHQQQQHHQNQHQRPPKPQKQPALPQTIHEQLLQPVLRQRPQTAAVARKTSAGGVARSDSLHSTTSSSARGGSQSRSRPATATASAAAAAGAHPSASLETYDEAVDRVDSKLDSLYLWDDFLSSSSTLLAPAAPPEVTEVNHHIVRKFPKRRRSKDGGSKVKQRLHAKLAQAPPHASPDGAKADAASTHGNYVSPAPTTLRRVSILSTSKRSSDKVKKTLSIPSPDS
jgi:hypothetical protein